MPAGSPTSVPGVWSADAAEQHPTTRTVPRSGEGVAGSLLHPLPCSPMLQELADDRRLPAWLKSVCRGTEMGELVLAHDWSATALGAPADWSIGLRTAVSVCLSSRFPMLVVWGPELVKIYNDGYRPILGRDKHPGALGASAAGVWPEIWDTIGPLFHDVMATGVPTWHEHEPLMIERNGFTEECFFVWSYSPLFDDDGTIGGVLDVVTETTDAVVAQRRLSTLTMLGAALVDAEQVTDVCVRAITALSSASDDLCSAEIHLMVGDDLARVASNRREDSSGGDDRLWPAADTLRAVALDRTPVVIGGDAGTPVGTMPAGEYLLPLGDEHAGVQGVLVLELNQHRPFDDGYSRFLRLLATTIGSSLESSFRRAMQLGEYRHISDTLQAAMLQPASDLPTVAARYLPAVGNLAVGGDWYDVIDLGHDHRAVVVGDCVGHGLQAATVMAQLRSAARAMLLEGRDPAAVLDGLDLFAATLDGADCATVVCVVVDRATDVVTYSRAGHPPPLLVSGSRARWLDDAGGAPLTIDSGPRVNATLRLHADDVIVCYSDGLVERRGESLDLGLARLADAALRHRGSSVQHLADALLRELIPDGAADDVVLVVKSLPAERH